MPLTLGDVRPGCIAYFDAQILNANDLVQKTGDPVTRTGPTSQFVCYKVEHDKSWWAPLTGTPRNERLRIESAWLSIRYGKLGSGGVCLQDGKNTYSGPTNSFISASAGETLHGARPYVSSAGVAAIASEVANQGGAT